MAASEGAELEVDQFWPDGDEWRVRTRSRERGQAEAAPAHQVPQSRPWMEHGGAGEDTERPCGSSPIRERAAPRGHAGERPPGVAREERPAFRRTLPADDVRVPPSLQQSQEGAHDERLRQRREGVTDECDRRPAALHGTMPRRLPRLDRGQEGSRRPWGRWPRPGASPPRPSDDARQRPSTTRRGRAPSLRDSTRATISTLCAPCAIVSRVAPLSLVTTGTPHAMACKAVCDTSSPIPTLTKTSDERRTRRCRVCGEGTVEVDIGEKVEIVNRVEHTVPFLADAVTDHLEPHGDGRALEPLDGQQGVFDALSGQPGADGGDDPELGAPRPLGPRAEELQVDSGVARPLPCQGPRPPR